MPSQILPSSGNSWGLEPWEIIGSDESRDLWFGAKPPKVGAISPDMQVWIDRYFRAGDKANAANKRRYQKMLQLWSKTGKQDIKDIKRTGAENLGQAEQSLASRGLYNSTVLDSTRSMINQDTASNVNRARDDNRMGRIGIMERRTDEGPDSGFYAQLLNMMGQAESMNRSRRRSGGILSNILGGNLF